MSQAVVAMASHSTKMACWCICSQFVPICPFNNLQYLVPNVIMWLNSDHAEMEWRLLLTPYQYFSLGIQCSTVKLWNLLMFIVSCHPKNFINSCYLHENALCWVFQLVRTTLWYQDVLVMSQIPMLKCSHEGQQKYLNQATDVAWKTFQVNPTNSKCSGGAYINADDITGGRPTRDESLEWLKVTVLT